MTHRICFYFFSSLFSLAIRLFSLAHFKLNLSNSCHLNLNLKARENHFGRDAVNQCVSVHIWISFILSRQMFTFALLHAPLLVWMPLPCPLDRWDCQTTMAGWDFQVPAVGDNMLFYFSVLILVC